ncbi:MAG: hypothetical protein HKN47_01965 [Pirellulaceae bacterium]|nr:hypothetical protein [Pirellulaceae bacterium]
MKTKLPLLLFAATLCCVAGNAKADDIGLAQVFGNGHTSDHVISLVLRHGVNNSVDLAQSGSLLHPSGFGPMVIPATELGDLQLMQVSSIPDADPACGPKFAIVVRNHSHRDVCGLRVSAVALLGRIRPTSPTTVIKVDKICAGESLEIQVQLPVEAVAMGNHNGTLIGFRRLLIAIDSFDQFVETNEANNIKVFDVASIPALVATAVVTAAETNAVQVAQATVGTTVTTGQQSAPESGAVTAPSSEPAANTAVPNADNTADDLQSAMQKMNAANPSQQAASAAL